MFRGVRWHTKNSYVPYQAFIPHFFYAGAHGFVYMFFCLDTKESKNQGCDALLTNCLFFDFVFVIASQFAKNGLRYAKMPELAPAAPTFRTAGIF